MKKITYIDEAELINKKILLRVDYNVSLNDDKSKIADDARIAQSIPTIQYLLKNHNKLILVSHLDRPKTRDPKFSLKIVCDRLKYYLPAYKIRLIDDFLTIDKKTLDSQKENEIYVLENIRFYLEEKNDDLQFSKKLASLADAYVNDAFAVSHRPAASVVGVPQYLPSYGGLLLRKEIETIKKAIDHPEKPFVTIIGGAKVSTKITLISKLIEIADYVLLG
jgi:3-phosphoglycerate kinase